MDEMLIDDSEFLKMLYGPEEEPAKPFTQVLKGGRGSGNFGHMGRPGLVGGAGGGIVGGASRMFGTPEHQGALFKKIHEADGGFTYDAQSGTLKTTGYALSVHPDRGRILDVKSVNLKALVEYAKANHDLLTQTNNYLGGWHNPEDHKVYLDVSTIVDTAAEAESLGRAAKQISYFDFSLGKSVNIDYTGEKEPHVKAARETNVLRYRSKRWPTDS